MSMIMNHDQETSPPSDPDERQFLRDALAVWCPTWPRRIGRTQLWGQSPEMAASMLEAISDENPRYVSVYGFPEGHVTEGKLPAIDTLFIDLDIPPENEYGRPDGPDDADTAAWFADMDEFCAAIRAVADALVETDKGRFIRASLSGHKGVHLFLDIPELRRDLGTGLMQYKQGLSEFSEAFVAMLEETAGVDLSPYVDVDSSDLSRLTRLPNTLHEVATQNFGERRYCVPVSVEELSTLTPINYVLLTRRPRALPEECTRIESMQDAEMIGRYVMLSPPGKSVTTTSQNVGSYKKYTDESYTLFGRYNSVEAYLKQTRPYMWDFRERPDCWDHGSASQFFEFAIMQELILEGVPVDVIVEFFASCPNFDEGFTRSKVHKTINWGGRHSVSETTLREHCPMFMPT